MRHGGVVAFCPQALVAKRVKPIQKIAAGSIAVGCLVFAGKMLAAKVIGCTALFSDALEALVSVASSALGIAVMGWYKVMRSISRLLDEALPAEKAKKNGALVP